MGRTGHTAGSRLTRSSASRIEGSTWWCVQCVFRRPIGFHPLTWVIFNFRSVWPPLGDRSGWADSTGRLGPCSGNDRLWRSRSFNRQFRLSGPSLDLSLKPMVLNTVPGRVNNKTEATVAALRASRLPMHRPLQMCPRSSPHELGLSNQQVLRSLSIKEGTGRLQPGGQAL